MLSKPAPFRRRVYAYAIDQLLLSFAVGYPLSMGTGNVFDNLLLAGAVTAALFSILYWALMDFLFGQSLGKQAVKIRTSGVAKIGVSFPQALFRSIPKAFLALLVLDCMPLLFGGDSRFSDRVTRTRVIEWAG